MHASPLEECRAKKGNVTNVCAYDSVFWLWRLIIMEESSQNKNNIMWCVSQRRICICSALMRYASALLGLHWSSRREPPVRRATNHMMAVRENANLWLSDTLFSSVYGKQIQSTYYQCKNNTFNQVYQWRIHVQCIVSARRHQQNESWSHHQMSQHPRLREHLGSLSRKLI